MEFTKDMSRWLGLLLVLGGCAAGSPDDDKSATGSGGDQAAFGNAGMTASQPTAGTTSQPSGSGGSTAKPTTGSGGSTQAAAGSGGKPAGSGGSTQAAAGSGGSTDASGTGGSGSGDDDPFDLAGLGLLDDAGMPTEPLDKGALCADRVCFDVFDCYLWHTDALDCEFTECDAFVCK
jgi:hypothetical protein